MLGWAVVNTEQIPAVQEKGKTIAKDGDSLFICGCQT
jgi:hypothetical protein